MISKLLAGDTIFLVCPLSGALNIGAAFLMSSQIFCLFGFAGSLLFGLTAATLALDILNSSHSLAIFFLHFLFVSLVGLPTIAMPMLSHDHGFRDHSPREALTSKRRATGYHLRPKSTFL